MMRPDDRHIKFTRQCSRSARMVDMGMREQNAFQRQLMF